MFIVKNSPKVEIISLIHIMYDAIRHALNIYYIGHLMGATANYTLQLPNPPILTTNVHHFFDSAGE
jgi:hypothetical protein